MAKVKQRLITTPETSELIEFHFPYDNAMPIVRNKHGRNGSIINELEKEMKEKEKLENRIRTISRNTAKLWRLHNSNANQYKELDKFMTLTFAENVNDISACDLQLKKFFKRLMYFTGVKFEYLGARELQHENKETTGRNALHYHMFLYGMPFVAHSKLLELWNYNNPFMTPGKLTGVNIKAIADGLNEMTSYLTSYALKEMIENKDFLQGRKTLIKSYGLLKPKISEFSDIEIELQASDITKGITFLDSFVTYYRLK